MPTSVVTALLVAAAVTTALSAVAAVIIAGVAVLLEIGVFLVLGSGGTDGVG